MDPSDFSHYGERMTEPMCEAIKLYLENKVLDDQFLEAIVCNNLSEACAYADEGNKRRLHVYVSYFYNYTPSTCWGSPEKVKAWLTPDENPVSG